VGRLHLTRLRRRPGPLASVYGQRIAELDDMAADAAADEAE
jgi:hypothetical protein